MGFNYVKVLPFGLFFFFSSRFCDVQNKMQIKKIYNKIEHNISIPFSTRATTKQLHSYIISIINCS